MQTVDTFQWQFGGWLTGLPVSIGWIILLVLLTIAVVVVHSSYRRSLRSISGTRRKVLFGLRAVVLVLIILCLANPTRVQRTTLEAPAQKPLTVLIDQSDSMTQKDNRGRSRLDEARRAWEQIRPAAEKKFGKIEYLGFAGDLKPLGSFEEGLQPVAGGEQTRLLDALRSKLEKSATENPTAAILTISDGLDTTAESPDSVGLMAIQSLTQLFFLPGTNRLRPLPFLRIREVDVPTRVLRQSTFNYQTVIERFASEDESLQIKLMDGETLIAEEKLDVRKGVNLLTWSREVESGEPRDRELTLEITTPAETKSSKHRIAVVEKTPVNVLYYQGALDWGYRFLNTILTRDPGFQVTALFNPTLGGRVRSAAANSGALSDLPSTVSDLKRYQIVILANVFANQLSEGQQRALDDYTRGGGGLLFIQPNDQGSLAFSGSKLESILPVVFEEAPKVTTPETQAERLRRQMQEQLPVYYGENPSAVATAKGPDPLKPFAFPKDSPLTEVLRLPGAAGQKIVPRFVDYARVRSVKPGAEILATHPTDVTATGEPRVLLATQAFGKGRASVLSTDSLWRWRLSLPGDSVEAATFWQQLIMWLAAAPPKELYFQEKWTETMNGQAAVFTIVNAPELPQVSVIGPDGKPREAALEAGSEPAQYLMTWTPDQLGVWEVKATSAAGESAHRYVTVVDALAVPDLANLPPDLEMMRSLATLTGGQMISDGAAPTAWRSAAPPSAPLVLTERRQLLWNIWWILALCLAVYATELILRRRWQLM